MLYVFAYTVILIPLQLGVKPVSEFVPFGHLVSVPTNLVRLYNNTREVLT